MSDSFIRCAIDGAVAQITLARTASRNALTKTMIERLTQSVREVADDKQVRMIVFAAEGPVFCAGMDLAEMQERASADNSPGQWLEDSLVYHDLLLAILEAPQPTLAVVQGPALAGGVGIALACDLVLAAEEAYFALPEPQRGITASMVTPLLVFRVGAGSATRLLLSGRPASAGEMFTWGACHQIVAADRLASAAAEWTASILGGSPTALAATKNQIREYAEVDLADQLRRAAHQSAEARDSADAREGLQAFLEKRKPNWNPD